MRGGYPIPRVRDRDKGRSILKGGKSSRGPGPKLLPKDEAIRFSGIEVFRENTGGMATCVADAEHGIQPTFALWAGFCLVAEWVLVVVPTKRTSRNPSASHEPKASSELRRPMCNSPEEAPVFIVGGTPTCPGA